jgi:hypothetical protein
MKSNLTRIFLILESQIVWNFSAATGCLTLQYCCQQMSRARELFAVYMSQQAREPIDHPLDAMPFHLRMLECMLDDTSSFFYQKAER